MKLSVCLQIAFLKIFRNRKNIYYVIVLMLFTFILLLVLNFKSNVNNYINKTIRENIGFRTISVMPSQENVDEAEAEIKKIENVDYVVSSLYYSSFVYTDFESEIFDGEVTVMLGNEYTLPKNILGDTFIGSDSNVAICPLNFYPSSTAEEFVVDNTKMLDGKDYLNKTFDAYYYSYKLEGSNVVEDKEYKKTFKIIGLYDSGEVANTNNICYISEKDIREISDVKNAINQSNNAIYNLFVTVNLKENVDGVINELEKMGYDNIDLQMEVDTSVFETIEFVCNLITLVMLVLAVVITITYTKKKTIDDTRNIGVLRSIGYMRKNVYQIYLLEILCLSGISLVIGVILFNVIYFLVLYFLVNPYLNMIFQIKLFHLNLIWLLGIIIGIPLLCECYFVGKKLKENVVSLLGRY